MARLERSAIGFFLASAVAVGISVAALAGPDLDVLMAGKSYVGKAYGTPDSTGRTGSVFEGYSFKVRISEPLAFDHIDIVYDNGRVGEMYVLNDEETGLMTFKGCIPEGSFDLYGRPAVSKPESFYSVYLPLWPDRQWTWRSGSKGEKVGNKWRPEDHIGTYVVQVDASDAGEIYSISQVKGDDAE